MLCKTIVIKIKEPSKQKILCDADYFKALLELECENKRLKEENLRLRKDCALKDLILSKGGF